LRTRLYDILSTHTGQPTDKIRRDCDRNLWLEADESLAYGLADKILNKLPETLKKTTENSEDEASNQKDDI
jgi:ATP-dependent Clp protease protease subunit